MVKLHFNDCLWDEIKGIRQLYGLLCLWIAVQVAELVAYVQDNVISLRYDFAARRIYIRSRSERAGGRRLA